MLVQGVDAAAEKLEVETIAVGELLLQLPHDGQGFIIGGQNLLKAPKDLFQAGLRRQGLLFSPEEAE